MTSAGDGGRRGVAADEPRNAGPIAFFRPGPMTRETVHARLAPYFKGRPEAELESRVEATWRRIVDGPIAPDPPIDQPLEAVADPWLGLSAHPDLVEALWALDETLPERCRRVFFGRPALVHPLTGVVFAVAIGAIGIAARLPAGPRAAASDDQTAVVMPGDRGRGYDISGAGPEWRFLRAGAHRAEWLRAAWAFAEES